MYKVLYYSCKYCTNILYALKLPSILSFDYQVLILPFDSLSIKYLSRRQWNNRLLIPTLGT